MGSSRSPLRLVQPDHTAAPAEREPAHRPEVDPSDFDAVFRRFAPYVARIGARLLGRADEVDDLVQDVFLDAVRGLRSLREPGAVRPWLATVAVRHARRRLRRRALFALVGLARSVDADTLLDEGASPETRAEVMATYHALERVPAEARIAWILSEVEGHSLDEIAAMCGYSRATAHRRIEAARTMLASAGRGAR